jgi:Zn-dependent protease
LQEEFVGVESVDLPSFSGESFLLSSEQTYAEPIAPISVKRRRPRIHRIAFWLAIATIVSTFWAGVGAWMPTTPLLLAFEQSSWMPVRQVLLANWWTGLQFSLALMAILVAHELGHYVMTIVYRVPSTPPLFIPFPLFSPIGTMGAVIMMQSGQADRKQIFDIGLAGPLAGLVVAIPILIFGILNPQPVPYAPSAGLEMGQPLLVQWLAAWLVPERAASFVHIANTQVNPLLMAGWVGLLVTGLNMMPVGQLDGGHVTFGLMGRNSYWIAVVAMAGAVSYMVYSQVWIFLLMVVLVFLMGLRHPPSSNDDRALGWPRQVIGWCSLVLPILCIPANPIY